MDMHPFLLIRVYLKRIFAFAFEYWTHNCFYSFFVCKYTEIFGKFQIIIEILLLTPYLWQFLDEPSGKAKRWQFKISLVYCPPEHSTDNVRHTLLGVFQENVSLLTMSLDIVTGTGTWVITTPVIGLLIIKNRGARISDGLCTFLFLTTISRGLLILLTLTLQLGACPLYQSDGSFVTSIALPLW